MSTPTSITFRGEHIHVIHAEEYEITPSNVRETWPVIGDACRRYDCWRVLVEAPAAVRREMRDTDAYRSAVQAMEAARGVSLALCFPGYQVDETTELFKLAAANRGVRVEFFGDRHEALQWLGVAVPDGDAPAPPASTS